MGEPAGIGAEITIKAWRNARADTGAAWLYLGDPDLLRQTASRMGDAAAVHETNDPADAAAIWPDAIPVLATRLAAAAEPGRPDPGNAAATLRCIEIAVDLAMDGRVGGIVTNPIQKSVLYQAGFEHPGHTEFLATLSGSHKRAVMMLVAKDLRTVPVTVHVPLAKVAALLSVELIFETLKTVDADLKSRFAIASPRIAVAGLNPHAGEGGAIGTEERDIIAPAIALARTAGIDVSAPLPADTMFHAAARSRYDVAVCMYHDQALIPVKTIGFDTGVNCTLGLAFVRTSPDHGTALDIAGRNLADPQSLICAIALARELASNVAGPS
jgi:4-hydroxythreonine-4-phosphate dehydrogenase